MKKILVVTKLKNAVVENTWPEKTSVCCWWCCHQFTNCPCTLPIKFDPIRKRFTFIGLFCSWNCTKAYNIEKNDYLKYQRSELITLLIQQMYSVKEAINIKTAPPRQCLKMFGGYMSIDEFRDSHRRVDCYKMNLINYNYIYPEVTEVMNVKLKAMPQKNLRLSRNN